ncbi:MAG: hypothetical protein KGL58_04755, partial [Pseudomonadota bacterium]|nr:hypothetical protein [Pseudomonadota bacterium]
RAALSTPVLGYSAKAIANLAQDEQVFEEILEGFYLDHQAWRERGFMPAFERIMQRFDVDYRMLAQSGGERSLTNLRHLAQLLQLRSDKTGQTGAELLSWFIRQQKGEGEKEALLQLESDANLIQIATVHASKGLEYPIVFCPFLWAGNGRSSSYPVYHNENDAIVMDFGTEKLELARQRAEEERYSESIRYLYVALTRASYRTYFSWGWINQVEESPLSWILYSDQSTLKKHLSSIRSFDAQDIAAPLVSLQGEYPDLICLLEDPGFFLAPKSNIDLQSLAPRIFKGRIVEARKVASYTSLTYGYQDRFERLEHEETSPFVDSFLSQPATECNIFSFPRGVIAGNCLHELLEKLDFTQDNQIDGLVEFILKRYGFDRQWNKVISATLRNVLEVEVIPGVQLNKIGLSHKCPELPFCFPMARISVFGLIQTLKKMHGVTPELLKQATGLSFLALQGFMKGFMDLVYESGGRYYLVDYKSNWLGNQVSDYSYDQLEVAMTRHAYGVQFMIYCVALNRYLSQRLCNYDFDQHFGGVQYLFLRGLMPGLDTGIYRVRPERGMIEQLDCYFRNGDSK